MLLQDFKIANGITAIELNPSTTGSGRMVGSVYTRKGIQTVVTKNTEVKNPDTGIVETIAFSAVLPVHVYFTNVVDKETGEITELITFSNKERKASAMVL